MSDQPKPFSIDLGQLKNTPEGHIDATRGQGGCYWQRSMDLLRANRLANEADCQVRARGKCMRKSCRT